jgi:anthranilate synthase component 1
MAAAGIESPPAPLRVEPSLDEVRELAREHNVIPLRSRFIDDCETPVSAFLKLRGLNPQYPAFLLESAEQGQRVGRWSFIGLRPRKVIRWSLGDPGDPYAIAAEEVARHRQAPFADMPPFAGGAVGYFGYDLVRTVEPLAEPNPDALGLPDMALMLSDVLVVFDHLRHEISVIANVYAEEAGEVEQAYAAALATIQKARDLLAGPVPRHQARPDRDVPTFASNMPREQFEAMVARIVEYVHAGDAFQVVPSQRWSGAVDVDPFSIYRGLRHVNPSPYMYFLDFRDFQVAGASPEPLLTVSGRRASTRPIAGTRPRGGTPEEDARIAEDLLADEKERAEHEMLVDLGRNDLGRVCEPGTVKVHDYRHIERYSHVMHLVSTVTGHLADGKHALDAVTACFPAGTLSGAPKVRAMQLIEELEPTRRGIYGGIIGYLDFAGDADTAIAIRTALIKDGIGYVQAGAGVVADSNPEYEDTEARNKAMAVLSAIAAAHTLKTLGGDTQ